MKKLALLLLYTLVLSTYTKADTIDYWKVYYNKTKLQEFNQYSKGEIRLTIKDIKRNDTLIISYFRDTPCENCSTQITIENQKNHLLTNGQGRGTGNPIKISVYDLLLSQKNTSKGVYTVYYQELNATSKTKGVFLFKIILH